MTTPLIKSLSREVLVAGAAYRVTIAVDRLILTRKDARKGIELSWDDLLALDQRTTAAAAVTPPSTGSPAKAPAAVLSEVARELRAAVTSLTRADETLTQAGALPAALMADAASDPTYGRARQEDHWFVEPLLTLAEVASILRVSTHAVRRLPMTSIVVAGESRFLQSVVRDYLREQMKQATPAWRRR